MKKIRIHIFLIASLLAYSAAAKEVFRDTFELGDALKAQIFTQIEEVLQVNKASIEHKEEVKTFFSNGLFTFEKAEKNYRFKFSGKLTKNQMAIDRCEGDLTRDDKKSAGWKIEIDFCNFDL